MNQAEEVLLDRIAAYLRVHHTATVATVGPPDGPDSCLPHAATVFYALDRRMGLVFLSKGSSRHGRHIKAGSRVAVTVAGLYDDWREIQGVQLWGRANQLRGPARLAALAVYVARFPYVAGLLKDPAMARRLGEIEVFRVSPERAAFTDNQAGPFGREVLDLEQEKGA